MVGKNLGDAFDSTPGRFRRKNTIVGPYRTPGFELVPDMINKFCQWLDREFHFRGGNKSFLDIVVQAIVTHLYIAWIHPFSDGNGRTARLLEFYLLMRAGVPDIASHILSNHYNLTRNEYYKQIDRAMKKNNLNDFLTYALAGFRDGLFEVLLKIMENQLSITWRNYIYSIYDRWIDKEGKKRESSKRKRNLALRLPIVKSNSEP